MKKIENSLAIRIVSLLISIAFVCPNLAYSSDSSLRLPLITKRSEEKKTAVMHTTIQPASTQPEAFPIKPDSQAIALLRFLLDRGPLFKKEEVIKEAGEKVEKEFSLGKLTESVIRLDGTPIDEKDLSSFTAIGKKMFEEMARKDSGLRREPIEGEEENKIFAAPEQWLRVSSGASLAYSLTKVTQLNAVSLQTWAKETAEKIYKRSGTWSTDLYSQEELDFYQAISEPDSDFVIVVVRPDHIFAAVEKLQSLGYLAITNDFPEVIVGTTPIKLEKFQSGPVYSPRNAGIKFILDPTNLNHPHPTTLAHAVDIAWQRNNLEKTTRAALVISNKMGDAYSNGQMIFYPSIEELRQSGINEITLMLDGVYEDENMFYYLREEEEQITVSQVIKGECRIEGERE